MKKILAVLFVVLLLLGLCSCAADNDNETDVTKLKTWLEQNGEATWSSDTEKITVSVQDGQVVAEKMLLLSLTQAYVMRVTLAEDGYTYRFTVEASLSSSSGGLLPVQNLIEAEGKIDPAAFNVNTLLDVDQFYSYDGSALTVQNVRTVASGMCYDMLFAMDSIIAASDVTVKDLGFTLLRNDTATTDEPFENYKDKPFMDRLAFSGSVVLEGLGMVFAVLGLLWGILAIFRLAMQDSGKKQKEASVVTDPAPQESSSVVPDHSETDSDGELIAAITAAVAEYLASEEGGAYTGGFRVVSFKRTGNGSAWNKK